MGKPKHKNTSVKMMLCVRTDLKMQKGKMCSQSGHAALGLYMQLVNKKKNKKMLEDWFSNGQKKIVAKLKDEAAMNLLISKATDAGIEFYTVQDAGRTQVVRDSRTIVAFIDYENKMNTITSRLKLM